MRHWESLKDAQVGDIVLHYTGQQLVAVSTVIREAVPQRYPYHNWNSSDPKPEGTTVEIDLAPLRNKVHREDIPLEVRQGASVIGEGGPFQRDGRSTQQGYFFPVEEELQNWLLENVPEVASLLTKEADLAVSSEGNMDTGDLATDVLSEVATRKEQAWLRRILLDGADQAECGICGRTFPARYLHAAHIKKRADASDAERMDENIAMLACLFGCDAAFECGDILVTAGGMIRLGDPEDPFLKETFGHLQGTRAPGYNEGNAHYFADRTASFVEVPIGPPSS